MTGGDPEAVVPEPGAAAPSLRVLKLYTDAPFTHTGSHLRGFLIREFPDSERMHNHRADGRPRPSEIRYVVREKVPCIVGLSQGRSDLLEVYERVTKLEAPGRSYRVTGKELIERPLEIGTTDGLEMYRFATPWIALNQENHRAFEKEPFPAARRAILEKIVVGNFLMACRAAELTLPSKPRIEARVVRWSQRELEVAGRTFIGFRATLVTNLRWDPWLGIGKMASKGFGLLESVR